MSEMVVKLSTGEEVTVKPFTMKQIKVTRLYSDVLAKILKSVDDEGKPKPQAIFDVSEDVMMRVVKAVYPDVDKLKFMDVMEIYQAIIQVNMEKN